jgi:hypothetical protein
MKNAVFWDIISQFVPQRRHITSPLQREAGKCCVRFEVFTEVTMKNAVFWDVTPCGSKNRCFGGTERLHHQDDKDRRTRNNVGRNQLVRLFLSP